MYTLLLLFLAACAGPDDSPADGTTTEHGQTPDGGDDDDDDDGGGGGSDRLVPTDLLTSTPYDALRIELDYVVGKGPDPEALALLEDLLDELQADGRLVKPGGVEIVLDDELEPLGDADTVHTFAELDAVLGAHGGPIADGDAAVIHGLYVDGAYEADDGASRVLGFAYGGGSLVMLRDNIADGCEQSLGGLLAGLSERACEVAEATVLAHELGHLFGLVNNGLPMVDDHEDLEHTHHDSNADCLMYWAVERTEMIEAVGDAVLAGDERIKPLDDACLADLAAAQAR